MLLSYFLMLNLFCHKFRIVSKLYAKQSIKFLPFLAFPDHGSFLCYLSDMLSVGGGWEITVTIHVKTALKKFRELIPVLTSRHLSYKTRGHVYSSCVRSTKVHASETWPLTKTNLQCNDRATNRQICSIKPEDVAMVSGKA